MRKTTLTDSDIINIKRLYYDDLQTIKYLKSKYHVCIKTLYKILNTTPDLIKSINVLRKKAYPYRPSPEIKEKISKKLKESHSSGRHPGWKHINESKTRRSYPEKVFYDQLTSNKLFEKYTILEKLPVGKYFLDFVIVELKIDIEIDGQQHFRTTDAIQHDAMRDNYLKENGWVVYRIAFKEMLEDLDSVMTNFMVWLEDTTKKVDRYYDISEVIKTFKQKIKKDRVLKFYISKQELENLLISYNYSFTKIGKIYGVTGSCIKKRCVKYGIPFEKYKWQKEIGYKHIINKNNKNIKCWSTDRRAKMEQIYYEKEKYNIEKVKSSNIDFTKVGWVQKVSNLIGKKHQKVRKWMNKYLPTIPIL